MKHKIKGLLSALTVSVLGIALLSACGSAPRVPEDSFYRLNVSAVAQNSPTLDGVVEVGRFAAAGSLGNRPLLMLKRGTNLITEYHYHFWIESPPTLLQSALVSYLRAANVGKRVVRPDLRATPDYMVTGRVLRMETIRGKEPVGLVELQLFLRRESDGKVLILKDYSQQIPADEDRVQAGAIAIEKAVNKIFSQFVDDIRKLAL